MAMQSVQDAKALFERTVKSLTESKEEEIYERLALLVVDLDEDPLIFGPKRLQEKIYQVRKCLDEVEVISLGASQRLFVASQDFRARKAAFDLAVKYLCSTDDDVRAERAKSDREAKANIKLRDELEEVNISEAVMMEMTAVTGVIKDKKNDLKNLQGVLREQLRLCGARIDRGESWGSQVPQAKPLDPGEAFKGYVDIPGLMSEMGELDLPDLEDETSAAPETPAAEANTTDTPESLPLSDQELYGAPEGDIKVSPIPKYDPSTIPVVDGEVDNIGDWLDEIADPKDSVPPVVPEAEVPPNPPVEDLSGVDLPQEGEDKNFSFSEEVGGDFEALIERITPLDQTRTPKDKAGFVVSEGEGEALEDFIGDLFS